MIRRMGASNAMLSQTLTNIHLQQLDRLIAKIHYDCQAQRNRRIHPIIKRSHSSVTSDPNDAQQCSGAAGSGIPQGNEI